MEMDATGGDGQKDGNQGDSNMHQENVSPSIASVPSMDSSCSVSSSKTAKAAECKKNQISELVGKSKKAAFSLWTLLHAKNCRLGVDRCSHPGCSEAKLMYLHHKTCSAVSIEPCPTQHKGCQDARKLLAHYRRCREIRSKQAQNPNGKSKQQHVCLVCSLVARHAKFTLDRNTPKNGTTSHFIPSLNLSCYGPANGRRNRSMSAATYSSSFSQEPRFAFSRRPSNSSDGSSGFQALQAAVSCALNSKNSTHAPLGSKKSDGVFHRPRAESLDVRRSQTPSSQEKNMSYLYLAAVDNFSEELEGEIEKKATSTVRRRSLSCSVPSHTNKQSPSGGSSILQKSTIAEDLQYILGEGA